jgi:hypothetical protein
MHPTAAQETDRNFNAALSNINTASNYQKLSFWYSVFLYYNLLSIPHFILMYYVLCSFQELLEQ